MEKEITKAVELEEDAEKETVWIIRNMTKDKFLKTETRGKITHTAKMEEALVFNDEDDVIGTQAMLDDIHIDCFTIFEYELKDGKLLEIE